MTLLTIILIALATIAIIKAIALLVKWIVRKRRNKRRMRVIHNVFDGKLARLREMNPDDPYE